MSSSPPSEPPANAAAKSKSPASPTSMDPPLQRCPELWFSDCGLIVQAENVIFRVSRDMLAARSTVFKDMLALPQPKDVEMIEDCPLVRLPDTACDVKAFFRALFDPEFFKPHPAKTDYATIRAVLRLSNKYDVEPLLKRALLHFDQLILGCSRGSFESVGAIIEVINLCREVSVLWRLPYMLYYLSGCDPEDITSHHEGLSGNWVVASRQDQELVFRGAMILRGRKMSEFFDFIWSPTRVEGCTTPGPCFASKARLRRRIELTKKDALPLEVPFDIPSNMSACEVCKKSLRKGYQEATKHLKSSLPMVFGLHGWPELNEMRAASLN